jgi:ribonuclease D
MAIARQLLQWRDELARKLDRPARSILKDHLLIEIARLEITNFTEIRDLRGINLSDKHVHALVKTVQHAMTLPAEPSKTNNAPDFESPQETMLIALATAVIRSYCIEDQLAYGLVATKKSIRDLIRHKISGNTKKTDEIELLCGWRAQTVGALLDDLMSGRRAVHVEPVGGDLRLHVQKLDGRK